MKSKDRLRLLGKLLEQLNAGWIFVEGQKDRKALEKLGLRKVLTISGNLRQSCQRLTAEGMTHSQGRSPLQAWRRRAACGGALAAKPMQAAHPGSVSWQ
ncbi:hypothetical protein H0O00_04845 [Candidatus Micrarchaeota archaeon]|nr:hypothetical protein [Candidatus Micrarchaeota archaeon]